MSLKDAVEGKSYIVDIYEGKKCHRVNEISININPPIVIGPMIMVIGLGLASSAVSKNNANSLLIISETDEVNAEIENYQKEIEAMQKKARKENLIILIFCF